jgi:hypothetical protein
LWYILSRTLTANGGGAGSNTAAGAAGSTSGCAVGLTGNASQYNYQKHQKPLTQPEHEKGLKEIKPQGKNANLNWQIKTLESYGQELKDYLKCLQHSHRSLRQEISRLLALGPSMGNNTLLQP